MTLEPSTHVPIDRSAIEAARLELAEKLGEFRDQVHNADRKLAFCIERHDEVLRRALAWFGAFQPGRPTIVCLCGSTRFWREFQGVGLAETLAGRIVLSIGCAAGTDEEDFGTLLGAEYVRLKAGLDELHLRKIDLADEVLIINVGGYLGESTRQELAYAMRMGKTIRWLEPPAGEEDAGDRAGRKGETPQQPPPAGSV